MKLTKADKAAIQSGDSNYLCNKGIRYYHDQDYEVALEYFHLAGSMGNSKAIGNIGVCYMYGEGVPAEVDIALSYFKIAMELRDVDAFYELGKIYCDGIGVEKDKELGVYYYENALAELINNYSLQDQLLHPGLFARLAEEKLPGGGMSENVSTSYKYLLVANMGYQLAIDDGKYYYQNDLEEIKDKMNNAIYDEVRNAVKKDFKEEYGIK
ncbi:MAG: sel1 repeat family protein [Bacilli bacterium]|nr:sel1 repeat family protein [Bacilli bacterium]